MIFHAVLCSVICHCFLTDMTNIPWWKSYTKWSAGKSNSMVTMPLLVSVCFWFVILGHFHCTQDTSTSGSIHFHISHMENLSILTAFLYHVLYSSYCLLYIAALSLVSPCRQHIIDCLLPIPMFAVFCFQIIYVYDPFWLFVCLV